MTAASIRSRNQKPLGCFLPKVAAGLVRLKAKSFVLDGEFVTTGQHFETLHLAACRVAKLAKEYPARLVVFDLLADAEGKRDTARSLLERIYGFDTPVLKESKAV